MPLTALDTHAALVLIDLQKGIAGMPLAHPTTEVVARAAKLADAFRQREMPVVLVNVTARAPGRTDAASPVSSLPSDWAELVPELRQQPTDLLITKQRPGAFIGTRLDEELRQRGVTQVFLAGIATSGGVEATARSAFDYGYNVVLVVDAMTDRSAEAHRYCVETIFPRLAEADTTDPVLRLLRRE